MTNTTREGVELWVLDVKKAKIKKIVGPRLNANLGSVINALQFLDEEAIIISRPENIADCRALIVPGVGAFGDCAAHLQQSNFDNQLKEWISSGKPLMGICLGLQILFDESEESPGTKGLGIFS